MNSKVTFKSAISGVEFPGKERVLGKTIRIPILKLIKDDYPDFDDKGYDTDTLEYGEYFVAALNLLKENL